MLHPNEAQLLKPVVKFSAYFNMRTVLYFYLRLMCAGYPRTYSSNEVPHDSLMNTGPGDAGWIGSNFRVIGIIIWGFLNNWQYPLEGFIN
jgi:hypothetical protein